MLTIRETIARTARFTSREWRIARYVFRAYGIRRLVNMLRDPYALG